jgi:tRNA nucleotidyltransferase (CCA-adding enzyme)
MNLASKLKKKLPNKIYQLLATIGKFADKNNYPVYVVGGFVRDLILGVKNLDIDIVVEKDGIEFAKILNKKLKTTLVKYPKFGTATLLFPDKFKLDIATSRSEMYLHPGALPQVNFGSIKDDLYRRDFAINAMAVSLNKENFGELVDFFGGLEDLKTKQIKVLHNLSFVDDPTRIFRAVRFEQRYNFKIEVTTECLIKEAITLKMFEKVSGERLRNEITLLLSEKEPLKYLLRMEQLDQLRFIHPKIKLTTQIKNIFRRIDKNYRLVKKFFPDKEIEKWLIYFATLIRDIKLSEREKLCQKFILSRNQTQKILIYKRKLDVSLKILKKNNLAPSQIYAVLNLLPVEVITLILSNQDNLKIRQNVFLFLSKIRKVKLSISGGDLKNFNILPGPIFKKILDKILWLKIDGKIKNKKEELFQAQKLARELNK